MPHANRSKKNRTAAANPAASEVRAAREAAGHDTTQAARTIYSTATTWEAWEAADARKRPMHPAFFELYLLKTNQKTIEQVLDDAAQRALKGSDDDDDNRGNA